MGIFNSFFNQNNQETKEERINWIPLTEMSQLTTLISQSKLKPILIFKHSTRCGVSRMALKSFEKEFDIKSNMIDLYFLDLLNHREISSEIASKFNVYHQSPQVLVLKNEHVIYNDSHYQISASAIKKLIAVG
ncbi:MAG: bacillithiol system redox-active protein YtxJ [Lutibacter sp.]|uniref:bacillithiol system redox-active protein YtxJ n=1 Tax=Lutibacter sp. TaxID=1925666 RepID=UPI0017A53386|nr:bacillithiol system redox-active protein YtxJ [Lutibacter sp.]MBT8316222.1 bacillithiol system redox-active protein YtxJ [Lutibacter sp.]NNJ57082.1 bacillithiol system redox-active protein YtxJ [Lutibacter sp.]